MNDLFSSSLRVLKKNISSYDKHDLLRDEGSSSIGRKSSGRRESFFKEERKVVTKLRKYNEIQFNFSIVKIQQKLLKWGGFFVCCKNKYITK